MSFADPQTITISGVTTPLPRVNAQNNGSEYLSSDGLIKLAANSAYGRRNRRVLRVDHQKVAPTMENPSINALASMSCYIVFDVPKTGYTNAEALAVYTGFKTQFTATSDALITKLLGGES